MPGYVSKIVDNCEIHMVCRGVFFGYDNDKCLRQVLA